MKKLGVFLLAATMPFIAISCSNNDNNKGTTTTTASITTSSTDNTSSTTSSSSSTSSTNPKVNSTVNAVEKDFDIDLDNSNVDSGKVTFNVTNQGPSTHEFVVFKTDLDESDLPVTADATVEEDAPSLQHIDEIEDINPGSRQSLSLDLEPGHYVLICNLPGHYKLGMHVALDVN